MKNILIPVVITIIIASCTSSGYNIQNKKTDWRVMNLKDKVKSIKECTYDGTYNGDTETFEGRGEKGDCNQAINYFFNNKGNLIEVKDVLHGESGQKHTYKYDDKGNKVQEEYYDEDGVLQGKVNYKYDKPGNRIEKTFPEGTKISYRYDSNGNMIEESTYDNDGNLYNRIAYQFDDNGLKIEEVQYDRNGKIVIKYAYKYDSNGNETEINAYSEGKQPSKSAIQYVYDKKKNFIKKIFVSAFSIEIQERVIEYY